MEAISGFQPVDITSFYQNIDNIEPVLPDIQIESDEDKQVHINPPVQQPLMEPDLGTLLDYYA